MGLSSGNHAFKKQIDTFTAPGVGVTVDVSTILYTDFTIVVAKTGPVVAWQVVLEGSLDGINFTTIMIHTDLTGNNQAMFSGVVVAPCLYFRARCSSIVLGLGTSVTVTVVGAR